jgi:hypothetical protein
MERRIDLLNSVLGEDGKTISTQLRRDNGDFPTTVAKLKDTLPAETLQRASLVHSLGAISQDKDIVSTIANDPEITTLRDVALHYDNTKLAALATLKLFYPLPSQTLMPVRVQVPQPKEHTV